MLMHKHAVVRKGEDISYNSDRYARRVRKDELDMLELAP
jgi:hypothetical protein